VVLISHKLEEVRSVADRLSVLRQGVTVASGVEIGALSTRDIARLMVGGDEPSLRTTVAETRVAPAATDAPRMALDDVWAVDDRGLSALKGVSLSVEQGEILGIAGVAGNGQRELAQVITGMRTVVQGRIRLDRREVTNLNAHALARRGIAHIPEDRLGEGLVGNLPVADNAILRSYDRPPIARGPIIDHSSVVRFTRSLLERFNIRGAGPKSTTRLLSGGQLQRLVLAREMALEPSLVVAVHPTRGLDVSASEQVQQWLREASAAGAGVLLISEDLDEVLQLSDRVAVLYEGRIVGTLHRAEADRATIGVMMAGSHDVGLSAEVA
jgi:simple sugar transport system ATP-binding protein